MCLFTIDFYLVLFLSSSVRASRVHLVFHGRLEYSLKMYPIISNYLLLKHVVLVYVSMNALINI